jgi:hypothetical protein
MISESIVRQSGKMIGKTRIDSKDGVSEIVPLGLNRLRKNSRSEPFGQGKFGRG